MSYKLTQGWPQHIESGAFVNPETNQDYLIWLEAGNTPEPAPEPPAPPLLTPEEKLAASGITVEELKQLLGLE
jgi:hypothetical protein